MGVVIDYIGTYAMMYVYVFLYLAKQFATEGENARDAMSQYMSSNEGLMIGFLIGALGTALGGFVAGWRVGSFEIKHGAFVGLGSLIVSFLELVMRQPPTIPEWFRILSVLAIIPAGRWAAMSQSFFGGLAGQTPWAAVAGIVHNMRGGLLVSMKVESTFQLMWIWSLRLRCLERPTGRPAEPNPDVCFYLGDRYLRLAERYKERGSVKKARNLRLKAEKYLSGAGPWRDPPYATAMRARQAGPPLLKRSAGALALKYHQMMLPELALI